VAFFNKYHMNFQDLENFRLDQAVRFHDELNPAIWTDDKLSPDVRRQLLDIAQDFIDHLGLDDLDVQDITLSGSNAAYTYTPHSDLDLHLIVDMSKLDPDEVYRELFNSKKVLYNDSHDIKIHGYDVELYVQDAAEPVKSLGEYSIKNDRWIKFPRKTRTNLDERATREKFRKLVQLAQLALANRDLEKLDSLIDTLKRYRQAGLDEHGEFGPENLAYKAMRTQGIIQQLYDLREKLHSHQLSLDESEDDEYAPPGAPMRDVFRIKRQMAQQQPQKLVTVRGRDIGGSFTDAELQSYGLRKNQATGNWMGTQVQWDTFRRSRGLREASPLDRATLTPQQIMRRHGISYEQLIDQLTQGIKVELEHTTNSEVAYKIALAHLAEDPDYYTKLSRVGLEEASGYIPSESEKNDPRFKTALTVDVRPDSIKRNAQKLGLGRIHRSGIPPIARPDGKV
jgi:hypothetical protein